MTAPKHEPAPYFPSGSIARGEQTYGRTSIMKKWHIRQGLALVASSALLLAAVACQAQAQSPTATPVAAPTSAPAATSSGQPTNPTTRGPGNVFTNSIVDVAQKTRPA